MSACFVGLDTSNYTTSAAICTASGEIIANLKAPLPVKAGECGLRQSDAVFAHVKNLPVLMKQLKNCLQGHTLFAIGVSDRPRGAEDSYMPCFLSGVAAAEALAVPNALPVFTCTHQEGHVMAALHSSGAEKTVMEAPFAAFHVSGGTTEVLYVQPRDVGFDVRLVGETKDLNAGQAIDRAGVMMGLHFPCGREMEALARENTRKLPKPRICVRDGCCHLSGLQNLAEQLWRACGDPAAVSAFVFDFIGATLVQMTAQLDARMGHLPVVYAGGVMSNRILQERLALRADTYFAEPQFSADNAAGVALLCRAHYLRTVR